MISILKYNYISLIIKLDSCTSVKHINNRVKESVEGLPWWRSGWESACQCRGRGFEPWSGRIPHAAGQLDPWATAAEPARLEPVLRSRRGRDGERPAHRSEEWPPLATAGESPRTETKTNIAINQSINKLKKKKKESVDKIYLCKCCNDSCNYNFSSL